MSGIHIVTDSAGDISSSLASDWAITVVPLTIRFGSEELVDQRDLDAAEFWRRCKASPVLPETSAPSPGAFQAAYSDALDAGADGVLCITISSKLSATYQSACAGAEALGPKVSVIDSQSVTMGQGLLAVAAASDAKSGASLQEVEGATRDRMGRTRVYGVVDTLDHLKRGGRIGGAQALLGSLLSIKPVIQVVDGEVEEESKQRTRSRSLDYLASKALSNGPFDWLAVCNGAAEDIATLTDKLSGVEIAHPMITVDLGAVVGTHTGPGTVGLCYLLPAGAPGTDG
jgi:DegV family protein with EDD domain